MACLMIVRYLLKKNFIRKESIRKEPPAQYSTGIRAMGCKQDQHAAMGHKVLHWFVNSQMNQIILYLSKNTVTITISFIHE